MKHIYTVEGYVRAVKENISQDILDFILFLYTEPIIINIKWKNQIKPILYLPAEPEWYTLEIKIANAFRIRKGITVSKLTFEHGDVTSSNWKECRWEQTHTFEAEIKISDDIITKQVDAVVKQIPVDPGIKQIDEGLQRYYKKINADYTDNKFIDYCDDNGFDDEAVEEELKA
eukprot:177951_1